MHKRRLIIIGLAVVTVFSFYFIRTFISQQKVLNSHDAVMNALEDRINKEREQAKELKEQIDILTSDEYVEKVAREQLGMVKPGEKVFVDISK